eukprot:g40054.t1
MSTSKIFGHQVIKHAMDILAGNIAVKFCPYCFSKTKRYLQDDLVEDLKIHSLTQNQAGNGTEKESNPTTRSNSSGTETRERRRSYLTPVRDEEAEAQRKARSRHARQSRRSTQGVTLTDLQEAEKTIGSRRDKKTAEHEKDKDKEREKEEKEAEAKDAASKYRYSRTSQDE